MNVLIIDDEVEILEIIDFLVLDQFPSDVKTFTAESTDKAIEILRTTSIDLCICDHNMSKDKGSIVLKFIIENKLESKFVLCSTVLPEDVADLYPNEHIFFNIIKPEIFGGIEKLATLVSSLPKEDNTHLPTYIPISVDFLYGLEKTPADIYIKMSDDKYLKCLNSNEAFSLEEKEKYQKKSINLLYCSKQDDHDNTQKIIKIAVEKIMSKLDLPLGERMEMVHSQLVDLIKFSGMTPELSLIVKDNIAQTTNFIMKNCLLHNFWIKLNLKGEYPSKLYVLHTMLASVVLKKLTWNTETTLFKLTMAAFFQDITLDSLPLIKLYDYTDFKEQETQFTRKESVSYLDHPFKANEILASIKNLPPDIDKIILDHHELPDGSGFPRKLTANKIGPLSCTFILTGLLTRYILNKGSSFELVGFIKMAEERGYNKGNFKPIFEIIKNL